MVGAQAEAQSRVARAESSPAGIGSPAQARLRLWAAWEGLVAGRREFAGRVITGPYLGHDLLIRVYGETDLNRSYEPKDFDFAADYFITDEALAGPGDDDPDPWFATLDELNEWLLGQSIDWYPPYVSLARLGSIHGYDGKRVP
jgi:hypothetical protein